MLLLLLVFCVAQLRMLMRLQQPAESEAEHRGFAPQQLLGL